ncbi:MAG: hypothetical protein M1821_004876 [Bathelium mastoideum]|nr:MAG: hypothetical protein M1821_004876 [Bathelium mastoideum]
MMTDRAEYLPMDGRPLNADDTAQSLLSRDEKDYVFEGRRPAKRRYNFALKGILGLLVLVVHAVLVVLLGRWILSPVLNSFDNKGASGMGKPESQGGNSNLMCQSEEEVYHRQHTIEGSHRDPYKDPDAEFLYVDPCGNSAAEARARGCRYGLLYGAWLPEECYDEETEENFKNHTNWRFWLQPNRTEELSWDEAAKGEHDYVLVEWEYHQRHCAEMNRRLFTAVSRRGLHTIDSYLSQWKHIDHCAHAAMVQRPYHELGAILYRKFPDCGLIRWKN